MYCGLDIGNLLLRHASRGVTWCDPVFMIVRVKNVYLRQRLEKMCLMMNDLINTTLRSYDECWVKSFVFPVRGEEKEMHQFRCVALRVTCNLYCSRRWRSCFNVLWVYVPGLYLFFTLFFYFFLLTFRVLIEDEKWLKFYVFEIHQYKCPIFFFRFVSTRCS